MARRTFGDRMPGRAGKLKEGGGGGGGGVGAGSHYYGSGEGQNGDDHPCGYELSRCNSYDFDAAGNPIVAGGGMGGGTGGAIVANASSGGVPTAAAANQTRGGDSGDYVYVMERHLVPIDVVQTGMSRFSFLLDTCVPGTVPDPLLIAALLDLVSFGLHVASDQHELLLPSVL